MDKLFLKGIQFKTKLGLYAWEQDVAQTVLLDLTLGITNKAVVSRNLADTVNYAELVENIREHYQNLSFDLIEVLAEDIAQFILRHYQVKDLTLKLIKPGILPQVKEVGIEIQRSS